ncbi:homoserine dehydrogenase [Micrococcales bacterium 31B]|nr:homoserine dehydrogenase [Micrococcales bacterium 31B]
MIEVVPVVNQAEKSQATYGSASAEALLKVAVLGCGEVGTQVVRLLLSQADDFTARVGARLELIGVAVRDVQRERHPDISRDLLTADAEQLVKRADLVVEVMGGIEPARSLMLTAIEHGASVITANKALLATDGPTLYEAADAAGVDISFEAAVAGAIPLIRPIRESMAGDQVKRVLGIVNGTTNYILDAMATTGATFDDALADAQKLGYAEADPTADIEGHDAAAKAAILASLAFHTRVSINDVKCGGITKVTAEDVKAADELGHVIKLLAIVERVPCGDDLPGCEKVSARVFPVMLPYEHPLANVRGAYNAVFVEAEAAGKLMFYGAGAGGTPTASAVLGDLVAAARHRVRGGRGTGESRYADLAVLSIDEVSTRFYVKLSVLDRPGVLATVANIFAKHEVSIDTVRQVIVPTAPGGSESGEALLSLVTHEASERALEATVNDLNNLDSVQSVRSLLRVEGA